jgi:predicted RecB family nuclease
MWMERFIITLRSCWIDYNRDLYKDAVSCFAFPTYGNGLKEIAKFMGYGWRHKDVNAMESIAIYFQYVKDPENNAKQLQKVIDY